MSSEAEHPVSYERRPTESLPKAAAWSSSTVIRGAVAEGADGERITRLAALAGSRPPEGLMLLAELQGDPVAAIGIFDGHAISDRRRSTLALRMRLRLLRLQLRLTLPVSGI